MKTPQINTSIPTEFSAENFQRILVLLQEVLEENARLKLQIKKLNQQLEWHKRELFGKKSEKKSLATNPYQMSIDDLLNDLPPVPEQPEDKKALITYERGKAKKKPLEGAVDDAGLRFDSSVPVEEIIIPCPELLGPNKHDYEVIDHKITYRLAQNPASYTVLKYTRPIVKKKSTQTIICPPAPEAVLEKSIADVSFLAGMLVDKFIYHLPLYRQHDRLKNSGILLARSTLTGLVKRSIALLKPLYQSQLDNVLHSHLVLVDETPIKAGKGKPGKLKQGYFWPMLGEQDEICFTFANNRSLSHLTSTLGEFSGTLLTDGYKAYEAYAKKVNSTTHALCWAHMRRGFERAEKSEPQASAAALAMIALLYQHEEYLRQKNIEGAQKIEYRQKNSLPIVDKFFKWLHDQRKRSDLVPSDLLSKAIEYAQYREPGLREFLSNAELPMDTNSLERALRCIPMGRKNWLFCWSELGAEDVGVIQSLLVTCKFQDINPYEYLVDVLQRVGNHPASRVNELTPRMWKKLFAENPLRSDLYRKDYHKGE